MIWLHAYLARRKRRRQIRQLEQDLAVLRPLVSKPARSLREVMDRREVFISVKKAELCLAYLRGEFA